MERGARVPRPFAVAVAFLTRGAACQHEYETGGFSARSAPPVKTPCSFFTDIRRTGGRRGLPLPKECNRRRPLIRLRSILSGDGREEDVARPAAHLVASAARRCISWHFKAATDVRQIDFVTRENTNNQPLPSLLKSKRPSSPFDVLQECAGECRNRASSMKSTEDFWSKKKFADHSTSTTGATTMGEEERQLDHWLLGRQQRMGAYNA